MAKTRNARRTVIQGVTATRKIASETNKLFSQAQTVFDAEYQGGVTRGLSNAEKVENQEASWKTLIGNADALAEIAGFWKSYAEANIKRLSGEDVDMTEFEGAEATEGTETEDVPLPA